MNAAIAIAIVIFITLVLIWLVHLSYKNDMLGDTFRSHYEKMINKGRYQYDRYFAPPGQLYDKTIGHEFDENTKLSLEKAEKIELSFRNKEKAGVSENELRQATTNASLIGDIYRFNVAPNTNGLDRSKAQKRSALHYNKAISRIVKQPAVAITNYENLLPPEFIIDRAETFYDDYINTLVNTGIGGNDNRNAVLTAAADQAILRNRPDFNQARNVVRSERKKKNGAKRGVRLTRVVVPSDAQNVHDSNLNYEIKQKFEEIKARNNSDAENVGDKNYTLEQIRSELMLHKFDKPQDKERALTILEKISKKNEITNLNTTEDQVLLNVWKRIHNSENQANQQFLKSSLFDALANSMDIDYSGKYSEVCAGGRCSRILDSLTLLDQNEHIAKPLKTTGILKNEIFHRSHKIIEEALINQDQTTVQAYNGKIDYEHNETLRNAVEKLEETLSVIIEREIRKEYSHIKPEVLDNIIKDAQAGI
jgi:hypothetical protein